MRRVTVALPLVLLVTFAVTGCGDDAEPSAFCAAVEDAVGPTAPSDGQLDHLIEVAPNDVRDDLAVLREFWAGDLGDLDDADLEAIELASQAWRAAVADCDVDVGFTSDDATATTVGQAVESFEGVVELPALGAPTPAPITGDETLDRLARDCEAGDLASCDRLFEQTAVDSPQETYAATCGGRLPPEQPRPGQCATFG